MVHLLSQGGNDSAQLASEREVGSKGMNGVIYRDVTVMGVIDMFSATIVGAWLVETVVVTVTPGVVASISGRGWTLLADSVGEKALSASVM